MKDNNDIYSWTVRKVEMKCGGASAFRKYI